MNETTVTASQPDPATLIVAWLTERMEARAADRRAAREAREAAPLYRDVTRLLRGGESMIDVAPMLGVEHADVMDAIAEPGMHPIRSWHDLDWLSFEGRMIDGASCDELRQAMRRPRLHPLTVRSVAALYGYTLAD